MTMGETLRSVSAEKDTAYGPGRFWVIDVDYANQYDQIVGVETLTGFGYRKEGEPGPPVSVAAPEAGGRGGVPSGPPPERRLTVDDILVGDRVPDLVHEVTRSTVVLGAMAARDWRPMHHDPAFAREHNGVPDIFLDTPTQQAWLERHLTDWTGPTGRLGRIDLRMGRPVLAGDTMTVSAEVAAVTVDITGCGWVTLLSSISVSGEIHSQVAARIAVPAEPGDNPWARRGADWLP